MKFLYSIVLTFILIAAVSAKGHLSVGVFTDPAHPGKCVVDGIVLSPGEEAQKPSECGRMICRTNGVVHFHTCAMPILRKGYTLGGQTNPTADYPDCCDRDFIPIV